MPDCRRKFRKRTEGYQQGTVEAEERRGNSESNSAERGPGDGLAYFSIQAARRR